MPQGSARIFVTTASPGGRTRVVEGSAAPEASQLRQDRSNIYDADAQFRSATAFSAAERDRLKRARDAALGLAPPPEQPPSGATVRGGRPPPGAAPARTMPSRRAVARGDAKPLSPRSKGSGAVRIAADSSPRRASKEATSPRAKMPSPPVSPPSYDTQALPASPGSSSGGESSYGEEGVSPPGESRPPAFPDHAGHFSLFSHAGFPAVARPAAAYSAVEYPQYIPWGAPALWPRDEPDTATQSGWWQPPAALELDAASAARAASAAAMAGLPSPSAPALPPVAARRPSQPSFDVEAARAAARAALAPRGAATPPPAASGELGNGGGSIRRFAAADFLPHGVRSLPGNGGMMWPPDAGGDIDARMRSLRAA